MKKGLILFLALVFIQAGLFLPVERASADKVKFNQSILPVEMVYLTKKGEVSKVWSNVSQKDDRYVLKFIASDGKTEIEPEKRAIEKFFSIKKKDAIKQSGYGKDVKFFFNNGVIEQVETIA